MANRPIIPRPPRRLPYEWGPVVRQRDRTISLNTDPASAVGLLNTWIRDADTNYPTIEGRPGFYVADESMGNVAVQWIGQLSKSNGTELSVVVAGGEIWTYNWSTDTLTKVVDATDFATATITLSTTARVRACEFQDGLTFSDGANRPFHWDGTAGDSGLTSLSAAPAAVFGRPFVHYGKQWFVKDSERSTLVWSEEGAVNTGYEDTGYTNAWTVRQTAQEAFYAAVSTNSMLVLFRGNTATYITGEVTPNFASTGNDEGISETVGCVSHDAVLSMGGGRIFFLSNDRRILRLEGTSVVDVGIGARDMLKNVNISQMARAFLEYLDFGENGERLILAIPETGSDHCNAYIIVNPATGLCEGKWTGWKSTALGRWKNASGEWRLVHGGGDANDTVDDGLVYIHDVPNGGTFADKWPAGDSPIAAQIETSFLSGENPLVEKTWLEGALLLASAETITGISATVITPRGEFPLEGSLGFTGDLGGFVLDSSQLDVDEFGGDGGGETRLAFGTRGVVGRWARMRLAHATLNQRFRLQKIYMVATPTEQRPSIR